jgi:hypothetical protein
MTSRTTTTTTTTKFSHSGAGHHEGAEAYQMGNDFAIALGVIVVLFHGFLQSFVVVNLPIHLPFPQQHNNRQSIPQQKGSYD